VKAPKKLYPGLYTPGRHPDGSWRTQWVPPDYEWLYDQYWVLKKSLGGIAQEVSASSPTVKGWMREVEVPLRTPAQRGALSSQKRLAQRESHPWWRGKGGNPHVRARRMLLRSNVPRRCARCGEERLRLLNAHHKDGNRDNNVLGNLQWLCTKCHARTHFGWYERSK